jgi:hypothetical protein
MVSTGGMRIAGIVAVGLALLPAAAIASHGKAGLWDVSFTMNMPNMPQISAAQMAQMQAMGVHMPTGQTSTVQRCMTAAEAASDSPPPPRSKSCTFSNVKVSGHTFSGDETCTGQFEGQGHFSVTYDGDEHYSGMSTMSGTANGHAMNVSNNFEGKWVSADCGSVK